MERDQIIEACARTAHEMNRVYCLALGDASQVPWEWALPEMKDSVRKGVEGALAGNTPEQSHESWLAHRIERGWVYGPAKDPNAKPPTHPCLVPYAELPEAQRKKDEIFVKTVRTMAAALGHPLSPSKMRYQIWIDDGRECSLLFNLDKDGNLDAASQATIDRHNLRFYEAFEGTRVEASKRYDEVCAKEMPPEPSAGLDPSLQHVGPMLNISLPSHVSMALVSVDKEKIGLIQSLDLHLDADSYMPSGTVKIVQYDPASVERVKLLQSIPWLKVEVIDYTAEWEQAQKEGRSWLETFKSPPRVALAPTPEQFKEGELSKDEKGLVVDWGCWAAPSDATSDVTSVLVAKPVAESGITTDMLIRSGKKLVAEFRGTFEEANAWHTSLDVRALLEQRKKSEESAKGYVRQEDDSDYRAE
jgi:RyR domain